MPGQRIAGAVPLRSLDREAHAAQDRVIGAEHVDTSATVRALALSQLEALLAPASRPLLEDFTRSNADQLERARATQMLSSLPQ